jgi:pantoate--beta-alanine ligase
MRLLHTETDLRGALAFSRDTVLVPTMGNLHAGHVALVESAKALGAPVVVSIFVNPLQFGAGEDFERYPRTLEGDCERLAAAGCDLAFSPAVAEMFPQPQTCHVEPPAIAHELEGSRRPGHFRGVATVVLKLFNMVQPKVAVFGKKDYQQLHILRAMVKQFNLPTVVEACETVRAPDGLALSSRNGYLTAEEREEAPTLYRSLVRIRQAVLSGVRDYRALEAGVCAELETRGWTVDYVSLRRQEDLLPPLRSDKNLVVLGAARLGTTRLIDNLEICLDH